MPPFSPPVLAQMMHTLEVKLETLQGHQLDGEMGPAEQAAH